MEESKNDPTETNTTDIIKNPSISATNQQQILELMTNIELKKTKDLLKDTYQQVSELTALGDPDSIKMMIDLRGILMKTQQQFKRKQHESLNRLDCKPDASYVGHYCSIPFAKIVEGDLIVAQDESCNLLVLDARDCKMLRCIPYGRKVFDVVASEKHIFVAVDKK
jgi:hypothetical protein